MNDSNTKSSSDLSAPHRGTGGLPTGGQGAGALRLSLLVAADENNVIGKNNKLPWHLPNDLKYFKNQTWGMPILMGRKTFESIGKPLAGRKSIVITRDKDWKQQQVYTVHSVEDAIALAKSFDIKEIFIIGGAEIFRTAFEKATHIYLTRIHHRFDGDVYFPEVTASEWNLIRNRICPADEKNAFAHTFQIWERKEMQNAEYKM